MSRQNSCRQITQSGEMRILASSFSTIMVAFLVAFFVLIMVMASKSILKSVSTEPLITRRLANPYRRWRMKGICEHRSGRTDFRLTARRAKTRLGLLSRNQKEALVALLLSLTVSFPWGNRSAKWDIFRRLLWRFGQGKVKRVRVNGVFSVIRFFISFSALA